MLRATPSARSSAAPSWPWWVTGWSSSTWRRPGT